MNYCQYYAVDVVNGPGTRCTLFVSGCVHQCRGCYNQSTQKLDAGSAFTQQAEDRIINDLNDTRIKRRGLSLSGGDPLHPANVYAVLKLVKRVRKECPDKDIWMWTGYTLQELNDAQKEVASYIDVLVDGRFEQDKADPSLQWRGSSNQIIHKFTEF
ncbi:MULTISPECIES: anaerobic ribonucleoside-triphosphate reductase-activating protein [unclassified Vibrio]|uniref:anaerobic ribonucleoside-triphosphate reductase-activating protein n=1 Tax=unclassified Vibrio TaxID=2614977 RepID=UPI001361BACF|nr:MULTISPECIES: anaerobic ribonucleoside-triphosphate reductase-activating protein [unclassified Vibrio]NAW56410.1 anaerobic ribonucleoside-triphosphate reductase-activating protein [Vibrio sp. V36_P2S2PM302]NAX28106.1 anaerobic ribonucleoside-triphosphate reductase-activating protein [Vibrio sp. V38_P2S17PM301]NAX29327.1 anaerobic ribonucleoside-triphosphate reductase-activating protein [Vibrio sp. V37_P2S8PM304]